MIYPPTTGPKVGPSTIPIPNNPEAIPLSFGSKASNKMAWEVDNKAPPPIPCINRQNTNSQSESEFPQK